MKRLASERLASVALSAVALSLAACGGDDGVRSGVVTKLTFIPAHEDTNMVPVFATTCTSAGSSVVCSSHLTGMVPVTEHVPDGYHVTIDHCTPASGCHHSTFEVDRQTYGTLKIGTWLDRDSPDLPRNI